MTLLTGGGKLMRASHMRQMCSLLAICCAVTVFCCGCPARRDRTTSRSVTLPPGPDAEEPGETTLRDRSARPG